MTPEIIYADANATYPVADSHYDEVISTLKKVDGNPSSIHGGGRESKVALEKARTSVAELFGASPMEIVFTSGATEANNLAIQGVIGRHRGAGTLPHVLISAIEHPSVIEPVKLLAERGLCSYDVIPVDRDGIVLLDALKKHLKAETVLVCVMHGNNELGTLNPLEDIAAFLQDTRPDIHLHVDAVQTFGKLDLTWYRRHAIHSAAVSAHKIGAFKGTGALFLRSGVQLVSLVTGGGQERARRPGTENMPGIVSFGIRCREVQGRERDWWLGAREKQRAWIEMLGSIPGAVVHGTALDPERALGNTVNFHIDGIAGDDILLNFDLAGIRASSGSACSSGVGRPSHVLKAIGLGDFEALNSVRTSFPAEGPVEQVARMAEVLSQVVKRVRS